MRSRYTAHVRGRIDYLMATWDAPPVDANVEISAVEPKPQLPKAGTIIRGEPAVAPIRKRAARKSSRTTPAYILPFGRKYGAGQ